jgi:hypothetical protein
MSGHTPGKWFTTQQGHSTIYVEARIGGGMLQEVAACGPTEAWQQQEANARLIASAPMLLEACELFAKYDSSDPEDFEQLVIGYAVAIEAARAAIAAATGEKA